MEGIFSAKEIYERTEIKRIVTGDGETPESGDCIDVGEWFRPVLLCGVPVLLVEKDADKKEHWKILEPKYIKAKY